MDLLYSFLATVFVQATQKGSAGNYVCVPSVCLLYSKGVMRCIFEFHVDIFTVKEVAKVKLNK